MEIYMRCIVLLLVVCSVLEVTLVYAQDDQSGFISIDCGIPEGTNYTDPSNGLFYVSDTGFTERGLSKGIQHSYLTDKTPEPYATLRSFPQGTRNCYTLRPAKGKGHKYLIRASFMYGNYDGKDELPAFDLFLNTDYWDTVNLTDASRVYRTEIIHVPSSDYLHVCLVKSGNYTPFISALELRPLEENMYTTPDVTLYLFARVSFDSIFNDSIRFKDDIYDRVWPTFGLPNSTTLASNFTVNTSNEALTHPPPKVMASARESIAVNGNLMFFWNALNITTDKFYIFMYFAELQQLHSKEYREFNIYLNGRMWHGPLSPSYLKATTIHSQVPEEGHQVYQFSINKTKASTLPALINALEVFMPIELSKSQTDDTDVAAMLDIKSTYKMTKNWQGDPCVPHNLLWDGLNCSYGGSNQARVISLNLTSHGLNGTVAPSIANLTALQILDLSNNNLRGQVPEFLAELSSLKILVLKGNLFSGPIPEKVLQKSAGGKLLLSIDNPKEIAGDDPNCTTQNIFNPMVAKMVAILWVILVVYL